MEKELLEKLKEKLLKEKETLEKELKSFAVKDDVPKGDWETKYPNREGERNLEEEGSEVEEYQNLRSIEYSLETKLRDIEVALEKIEKGNYGICEKCGKEIEEERLIVCPEAKYCLKCK